MSSSSSTDNQGILRNQVTEFLRQEFERSLEARVERFLEVNHEGIIPNAWFSKASSECIYLYRDGFFIASVMLCQSVNEAVVKYVAERNGLPKGSFEVLIDQLLKRKIVSIDWGKKSRKIWGSYRNDIHHLNPTVKDISFDILAKDNILRLAAIEREVFGTKGAGNGTLDVLQSKYWDIREDNTTTAYLRSL